MEKVLTLADTPIETYQGLSFTLSILLAHDYLKELYHDHYVNLQFIKNDDIEGIEHCRFQFHGVLYDHFRSEGVFEIHTFQLDNLKPEKLRDFLRERINQYNYIIIFDVDEFYLGYSELYKKIHFAHDTYIYGYEDDTFLAMAYSEHKLQKVRIPIEELLQGMQCYAAIDPDIYFGSLRVNSHYNAVFDKERFQREVSDYLNGRASGETSANQVFGINCYDALKEYLDWVKIKNDNGRYHPDLRAFRMLWEHKKVMKDHLVFLKERYEVRDELFIMVDALIEKSNLLFLYMMKYNARPHQEIIVEVKRQLDLMRVMDQRFMKCVQEI